MCGLSLTQVPLQVHDREQAEKRMELTEASSHTQAVPSLASASALALRFLPGDSALTFRHGEL